MGCTRRNQRDMHLSFPSCSLLFGRGGLTVDLGHSIICFDVSFGAFDTSLGILARPDLRQVSRQQPSKSQQCRRSHVEGLPFPIEAQKLDTKSLTSQPCRLSNERNERKPKQPSHNSPRNLGVGYGGWPTARTPIITLSNLRIT